MAMKRVDLEQHRLQYYGIMASARAAIERHEYLRAVELASSAWDYVDGMMQYERKYKKRVFESLDCVELVLRYAPLLLDIERLTQLKVLLNTQRRVEKNTAVDLGVKMMRAQVRLHEAHRLLDYLERNRRCEEDKLSEVLGGHHDGWASLATELEAVELIRSEIVDRTRWLLLVSRLDEVVAGKCPACGMVAHAPKVEFFVDRACASCGNLASFVIIQERDNADVTV